MGINSEKSQRDDDDDKEEKGEKILEYVRKSKREREIMMKSYLHSQCL